MAQPTPDDYLLPLVMLWHPVLTFPNLFPNNCIPCSNVTVLVISDIGMMALLQLDCHAFYTQKMISFYWSVEFMSVKKVIEHLDMMQV